MPLVLSLTLLNTDRVIDFQDYFIEHLVLNLQCDYMLNFDTFKTRIWANAQRDGCPAEYRWRLLFNAAKFD